MKTYSRNCSFTIECLNQAGDSHCYERDIQNNSEKIINLLIYVHRFYKSLLVILLRLL